MSWCGSFVHLTWNSEFPATGCVPWATVTRIGAADEPCLFLESCRTLDVCKTEAFTLGWISRTSNRPLFQNWGCVSVCCLCSTLRVVVWQELSLIVTKPWSLGIQASLTSNQTIKDCLLGLWPPNQSNRHIKAGYKICVKLPSGRYWCFQRGQRESIKMSLPEGRKDDTCWL